MATKKSPETQLPLDGTQEASVATTPEDGPNETTATPTDATQPAQPATADVSTSQPVDVPPVAGLDQVIDFMKRAPAPEQPSNPFDEAALLAAVPTQPNAAYVNAPTNRDELCRSVNAGRYTTKLSQGHRGLDGWEVQRETAAQDQKRLNELFDTEMIAAFGLTDHPKAQRAAKLAEAAEYFNGSFAVISMFGLFAELLKDDEVTNDGSTNGS